MLSFWYCIATCVEWDEIMPYPNVTGANGMFNVLCFKHIFWYIFVFLLSHDAHFFISFLQHSYFYAVNWFSEEVRAFVLACTSWPCTDCSVCDCGRADEGGFCIHQMEVSMCQLAEFQTRILVPAGIGVSEVADTILSFFSFCLYRFSQFYILSTVPWNLCFLKPKKLLLKLWPSEILYNMLSETGIDVWTSSHNMALPRKVCLNT
jgi:hypothetical protein